MKNWTFGVFTLLVVGFLILMSCNKPDRNSVSGHVLEYGTDKPIEGATVKLYGWGGEPLSGGFAYTVDSVVTDADGYYRIDDDGQFARSMTANARKDLYWTDYESERVVADGNYDNTDIRLKPYAWLRVKVVNQNGVYSYFNGYGKGHSGINIDTVLTAGDSILYFREGYGNYSNIYQFSIRKDKSGIPMHNTDSVNVFIDDIPIPVLLGSGLHFYIEPFALDTTDVTIIF